MMERFGRGSGLALTPHGILKPASITIIAIFSRVLRAVLSYVDLVVHLALPALRPAGVGALPHELAVPL